MKKLLIVVLICLNGAMLAALLTGTAANTARGQVASGATDYLIVSGSTQVGYDAIYVLDLEKKRLMGWRLDATTSALKSIAGRDLKADFQRKESTTRKVYQ